MIDLNRVSSLVDVFRLFAGKVAECRQRLEASGGALSLDAAQEPLLAFLARFDVGSEDQYATDAQTLLEARYLLACFADEQLTEEDVPLREAWQADSLEAQLFQTNRGGVEIFRRIDKLLELGDPGRRGLAAMYLLALALGFRGSELGAPGKPLQDYRQRLLALAAPDRASDPSATWLTPSAYRHTLGQLRRPRLPNLGLWAWIAVGAVAVLLLVSYQIFSSETAGLLDTVQGILGQDRAR